MPCQIQSHHMLNHRLAITNAFCVLILVSVLLAGQGATPARAVGTTLFVVPTKDAHECTSWADACDLQYALGKAASGDSVWVAQGTYQPTPGTDRAVSFQLETGVQIYGGFVGTETLLGQRNPTTHVTTLSGDIGTVGDSSDNSYHVVYASGVTSAGVLDGFTITGGHGTGGSYSLGAGAGMLTVSSSPTLQNLIVSGNYSTGTGGGMFNNGGAPSLTNVTFFDNEAANQGGGMYNAAGGHPVLTNASFQGNSALAGGGLYTSADLTIEHSEFDGNEAGAGGGGGIFNLGGAVTLTDVALDDNTSEGSGGAIESETGATTTLTDVGIHLNSAAYGGGIDNNSSTLTLANVILEGNSSDSSGGALANLNSDPTLTNVLFDSNSADTGGGIYNAGGDASLTGVTFVGNSAGSGGAMSNSSSSYPTLANVTFAGNSATSYGRVMINWDSSPLLVNVTFAGNSGAGDAVIHNQSSTPRFYNSILWDGGTEVFNDATSTTMIEDSIVQGGCPGTGCTHVIDADPLLDPLASNGGYTQTMALRAGSPAIDTAVDENCTLDPMNGLDQRGVTRPHGPHCDMGAYEYDFDNIEVTVGTYPPTSHVIEHLRGQEHSYGGMNSGPARVSNSNEGSVVSSVRVIYGSSSYSEMMGYPYNTSTSFWFPWYNNTAMDSQFRVSNLGAVSTTISVSLGGTPIDSFSLGAGAAIRKSYPGQNNGPMHVSSSGGTPILATIRVLYGGSSFSEMMGCPSNGVTDFWFPWYNNVAMDSQFRVSNLGASSTTITVSLAGTPIDTFTLGAGAAIRKNYAGQNNGPMHVSSSSSPILATIRVLYAGTSFSEMMGYANNITTDFWFPWYDNVGAGTQFRVSNLGLSATTVTVSLDGTTIDSFSLPANSAVRKSYTGRNKGGFHITSSGGVAILQTERILYGASSFYELMGYSGNLVTGTQYFPWYNNTAMDSQMRIAVP